MIMVIFLRIFIWKNNNKKHMGNQFVLEII